MESTESQGAESTSQQRKRSFSSGKRLRRLLWVSLGVVLVGGVGWKLVTRQLEKKLLIAVEEAGFDLEYEGIRWSVFPPGVTLKNMRLAPRLRSDSSFSLKLGHAAVRLGWGEVMDGNFQTLSRVDLHSGELVLGKRDTVPDEAKKKVEKTPQDWIVRHMSLKNVDVIQRDAGESRVHVASLEGSLWADYGDTAYQFKTLKKPLAFTLTDIVVDTSFKYHGFTADTVQYAMKDKSLRLAGLVVMPLVSRQYLDQNEPYISLHGKFEIPEVKLVDFDWAYEDSLWWHARKIWFRNAKFTLAQNKEKPLKPGKRPMPQAWIEKTPFQFMADTIEGVDGSISYTFTPEGVEVMGRVDIDQWDLLWVGYGNDSTKGETFKAKTKMRWMKSVWMNAECVFPYDDPDYSFRMSGSFVEGEFAKFNPVMEAAEGFRFESGYGEGLKFSFGGNDTRASGKMWVDYQDLKVSLPENEKGKKQRLKEFVANKVILKPKTKNGTEELDVVAERNQQQSVFSFWLRWLMTGLMDAMKRGGGG